MLQILPVCKYTASPQYFALTAILTKKTNQKKCLLCEAAGSVNVGVLCSLSLFIGSIIPVLIEEKLQY